MTEQTETRPATAPEPPDWSIERAELKRILESPVFGRSPTLSRLLAHVGERSFTGVHGEIKESTIAVDVFRRQPDFDPRHDPIVRVTANRLRLALARFYRKHGHAHGVEVQLPIGQYVPVFRRVSALPVPAVPDSPLPVSALPIPTLRSAAVSEAVPAVPVSALPDSALRDSPLPVPALLIPAVPVSALPVSALPDPAVPVSPLRVSALPVPEAVPPSPEPAAETPTRMPAPPSRAARAWIRALPLAAAALAGLLLGYLVFALERPASQKAAAPSLPVAPAALADSAIRILAGASADAVDPFGRAWGRDQFFEGGTASSLPALEAAGDHPAYRAQRKGSFGYDIPLPAGTYEVHLHFVETEFGDTKVGAETSRLFDVVVNGRTVIHDLDVSADAGASRTPDVKVLTDVSPAADGRLHLRFAHQWYQAILSGIEILPGLPHQMRPVRITALSTPYATADGVLFLPDLFVRGGRPVPRERVVSGTSEPGLFRAERFGHFRYTIPVAPGPYRLSLTFAETFFGAANGVPGGAGARVFDVFCNGEALLRNLDVFEEAGGENRALVRTFEHLAPNAQGKLILDFVPDRNLATVTAIELQAE